jgi:hypothetical protein
MTEKQIKELKKDISNSAKTRDDGMNFWLGYLYGLFDFNVINEVEYLNLKDHMYSCFLGGEK